MKLMQDAVSEDLVIYIVIQAILDFWASGWGVPIQGWRLNLEDLARRTRKGTQGQSAVSQRQRLGMYQRFAIVKDMTSIHALAPKEVSLTHRLPSHRLQVCALAWARLRRWWKDVDFDSAELQHINRLRTCYRTAGGAPSILEPVIGAKPASQASQRVRYDKNMEPDFRPCSVVGHRGFKRRRHMPDNHARRVFLVSDQGNYTAADNLPPRMKADIRCDIAEPGTVRMS